MNPPDLSITVVAWNRARELERLLAHVEGLCREVVVVDGGSQDDTAEVCRGVPRVRRIERAWDGHFARMKNASFAAATSKWILHLDLDERIGPRLASRLPEVCASEAVAFWRIPMLWLVSEEPARYVHSAKHYPCPVPCLFLNRPEHRYLEDQGPVHPRFPPELTRGMKKLSGVYLLHYCLAWATPAELVAKANEYAAREPGSEATNRAYYLWWTLPHEVRPLGDIA